MSVGTYLSKENFDLEKRHIAVVIPAYQVANKIREVLMKIPPYVRTIIVVNDASTDETENIVLSMARNDKRLVYLRNLTNKGVGGTVCDGYKKALELGADIIVKRDGDDQMDPRYLPNLIVPLIKEEADYTKGNRFFHTKELRKMPTIRLLGNGILGFLVRFCSGYWKIYDPTNGYTAINAKILRYLRLNQINSRFFFETDMLINLYIIGSS